MLYTLSNDFITVQVSDTGAELQSIKNAAGTEYLWQGDPKYWDRRAINLFPYIGRMVDKSYFLDGKLYSMPIHGFAPDARFEAAQAGDALTFTLRDTPETYACYPRRFIFSVTYSLCKNRLNVLFRVENRDTRTMYFGVGGHPGFRVPLGDGEQFEDYAIEFNEPCAPRRVIFSHDCFVEGMEPYPLDGGKIIPLEHSLFDEDAIVLTDTCQMVSIADPKGSHRVTVRYPDMSYIGFWQQSESDAPFLCIEPWSSLPSPVGTPAVLEEQKDLLTLVPGAVYENYWSIDIV